MSKRNFPDFIKAYLDYSAHSEAPDKFHFWTAVSIIAGALRRKVWIDMGYFDWTPNFYIIFVAPPGIISKSTTASIGMSLLRKIDGINFGPDAVTWQALITSLANSTEMIPFGDPKDELSIPMSAITIESSEFGTFLNPQDREMVDMLVSLWDGKTGVWKKSTKTQGDDSVENPWVNVLACTTPAWIAGNFPDYMIGGGFTSRCIFVFADKKRQFIAYPKNHIQGDIGIIQDKLVQDLEHISTNLLGEYVLTPDAFRWGEEWYTKHYNEGFKSKLNNDRFAGYLARKQTHVHKLAMVIAASQSDELSITADHLAYANEMVTALEDDMPHVFSHIGLSDAARSSEQLISIVRSQGTVSRIDLYRQNFSHMQFKEFQEVLISAVAAGYIVQVAKGTEIYIKYSDKRGASSGPDLNATVN